MMISDLDLIKRYAEEYKEYHTGKPYSEVCIAWGRTHANESWRLSIVTYLDFSISEQEYIRQKRRPFGWKYGLPSRMTYNLIELICDGNRTSMDKPTDIPKWANESGLILEGIE